MSIDDKNMMNPSLDQTIDPSSNLNYVQSGEKMNPLAPRSNTFSRIMDAFGPTVGAGLGVMPGFSGKSVVSTLLSSTLGGGTQMFSSQQTGFGSAGGMYGNPSAGGGGTRSFYAGAGGGLPPPPPPPPPGLGGGGGLFGAPPPPPGGGAMGGGLAGMGSPDQFQGQIDNMFNNNMMFLMIQTKVQNMSQQVQTVSNIMKADADSRLNAIRNFRS